MERAYVKVCNSDDYSKREGERMPEDFFLERLDSPEMSDLEVVNCTLEKFPLCW